MAGFRSGERMARQKIFNLISAFCILFFIALATAEPNSFPSADSGTTTNASGFSVTVFIPASNSIHSDQINDMINGINGSLIIGTSFGLSTFNGTWSTRHINRDNFSEGLLNDFITAVETDAKGNLWIGYSGGIQIFNGHTYETIRDQQILKDPRVTDLQRWNDDMWIATGDAGIHRYRNGTWTWFQPDTKTGSPFFTVTGMAVDTTGNSSLVIATHDEGSWLIRSAGDPVRFERLNTGETILAPLDHVRSDPHGGVYLFNGTVITHYSVISGVTHVLSNKDLAFAPVQINDVSGTPDGTLYVATDNGIYIWRDGRVLHRISSFDGIGPTNIVQFIFIDREMRVWYASQGYVGYIRENSDGGNLIPISFETPAEEPLPAVISVVPKEIPKPSISVPTTGNVPVNSTSGILSAVIDPILRAIKEVASRFGLNFFL